MSPLPSSTNAAAVSRENCPMADGRMLMADWIWLKLLPSTTAPLPTRSWRPQRSAGPLWTPPRRLAYPSLPNNEAAPPAQHHPRVRLRGLPLQRPLGHRIVYTTVSSRSLHQTGSSWLGCPVGSSQRRSPQQGCELILIQHQLRWSPTSSACNNNMKALIYVRLGTTSMSRLDYVQKGLIQIICRESDMG
jgi:hypothetical protein